MKADHPPKWGLKLLDFFLRPDYSDEIQGDITEAYHWRMQEYGSSKAKLIFLWEVLKSLRPTNLKTLYHFSLNTMIFRNYLKIAFRTLLKRKSTSFINILGLSMGVATFIFIFLYTNQILSFDDHHTNKERIFMAYKERITPDGTQETFDTWVPLKDKLLATYQQVKSAARVYPTEARVSKNNRYLTEDIYYTDESLFDILTIPLIHGNENLIFPDKNSIVLSQAMAIKYFDQDNPIGEELEIFLPSEDTTLRFSVSAVFRELPENIGHQTDLMIQMETLPFYAEVANEWGSSFLETLVLVNEKGDEKHLEADFPNLVEDIFGATTRENTNFKLLPMDDFYDTFFGNKTDARTLLGIGIGILLIAIINFMNLSTAQATRRAKEVGLRKVLGAFKGQLRTQFVTEAFVFSLMATLIGVGLVYLALPTFNEFFDVALSMSQFQTTSIILFILILSVSLGLLSGSYPAFYLSSIGAIEVLRQKVGLGGTQFRNLLVILQFSIALFLIACTFIVRSQIQFMSQKEMGFNGEGIMTISASPNDFTDTENGLNRLNTFKNELSKKSFVAEISCSRAVPTSWTRSFIFVRPDGWEGDPLRMRYTFLDEYFFDTYDIGMKYGTGFIPNEEGSRRGNVILNEAAAKAFEFDLSEDNAIKIGNDRIPVIAVTEDFHFESLANEVAPTLMFYRNPESESHRNISLKMEMSNLIEKVEEIEKLWNQLGSTQEFSYSFMDDRIVELYENEKRYLGMVTLFSVVSILVACLGLYGLALFIIEKKRKEISIRKVLGAEINTILQMIFGMFTKWVVIAFFISIPLAVYFANEWLESYFYHIAISWTTFAFALLIVLGLVVLTVGIQSIKAASANPVKYLKDE